MPNDDVRCELCHRHVPQRLITLHHLKPKSRGGTADDRVPICKPCHKQIHATFDNRTLDRELADVAKLRHHSLLEPFMKWIRKQAPGRMFQTQTAAAHPGKRQHRIRQRSG